MFAIVIYDHKGTLQFGVCVTIVIYAELNVGFYFA
jgi:hypothetical protein